MRSVEHLSHLLLQGLKAERLHEDRHPGDQHDPFQDDLLVGTPISERTHSETEGLIGLFLNTIVLRAQFTDHLNFRSLLQVFGKDTQCRVVSRADGDPGVAVNRGGKSEAVIVVGMLADEIHAARCAKYAGNAAKFFGKYRCKIISGFSICPNVGHYWSQ